MASLKKMVLAKLMVLAFSSAALAAGPPNPEGPVAAKTGTVSGQLLTLAGEPLAGGMVYFFSSTVGPPPAHDKYWRVPDFMKPIDAEGRFTVTLPEGSYYLGATKRPSGKVVGPPREGDYFYISADDKGVPVTYTVKNGAGMDLGKIAKAVPFKSSTANYGKGITAIEGTILDGEGKPVADALVFAFISAATVGRPLFTSDPTGKDGRFVLRVADSGTYYLKVRSVYGGGPPLAGEIIGAYGEKEPTAVTVSKGERQAGITIRVRKFPVRGPQAGNRQ
jgi:hypothetical protein